MVICYKIYSNSKVCFCKPPPAAKLETYTCHKLLVLICYILYGNSTAYKLYGNSIVCLHSSLHICYKLYGNSTVWHAVLYSFIGKRYIRYKLYGNSINYLKLKIVTCRIEMKCRQMTFHYLFTFQSCLCLFLSLSLFLSVFYLPSQGGWSGG